MTDALLLELLGDALWIGVASCLWLCLRVLRLEREADAAYHHDGPVYGTRENTRKETP
jgi:hypothetical protein